MSDDISHKKAMKILNVLSYTTGTDKDFFEEKYKKLRDEGYTRIEAVKELWEDEWFFFMDAMLFELKDKPRPQVVKSIISYISLLTNTLFSEDQVRKEYNELYLLLGDTDQSLKKTFDSIMNKYFEYLVGMDEYLW